METKMAAWSNAFQGYNFPFCGEENVSQSFVDYGSPSTLNIDMEDQAQKLLLHSNQSDDSQLQRLAANQLSLPFLEPNQRSSSVPEETLNDYQFLRRSCKEQISGGKCGVHVENFSADRPDIMYSSIAELIHDDMICHSWKSCDLFKSNSSMPWKQKETSCWSSCKLCSNFRQARKSQNSNAAQVVKHLSSALPDISPVLLYNLFQESHALEIPRFQYDTFLGNSLACNSLGTDHQGLLMYPSGSGLEVFNFSCISQCCESIDFENAKYNPSPLKPELSKQQFVVQDRIKQIDFASYSRSNIIVGIRSQYHCSFFQSCPSASGEGDKVSTPPGYVKGKSACKPSSPSGWHLSPVSM